MDNFTRYFFQHFSDHVWPSIVQHMQISGIALLLAIVISLPLGLLLSKARALATPVLAVLAIIYTIPSLALFAILVPLPFMDVGIKTAVTALTAYALVVLTRNTMVAFTEVDPAIREAATGMGMSRAQVLWRIEVPLALPVIVAGMRIAALSTIGLTTVAAWVGAGGLGQLLRDGISDPTYSKLYAGIISIGLITIVVDLIFRLLLFLVNAPTHRRMPKQAMRLADVKEA